MRIALSIAGSDSGGGAGIQADLKTFHRFGVYGATAITLVTAQNTEGVRRLELLPVECVRAQIDAVAEDLSVHATKTGALGSAEIVDAVADAIRRHRLHPLVVDPVLVSKHGSPLLSEGAVATLRRALLPLAQLVTPNRREAEILSGIEIARESDLREAARRILALGANAVLLKGGHLAGAEAVDLLYDGRDFVRLAAPRVDTRHTHGTGCTISAAITAHLARGDALSEAVRKAKEFVTRALRSAPGLGHGFGPLDHWA